MKLSTQPYKGTRDFYPEDMRLRHWMFSKMRQVCQSFGYEEYDGPVLEPLELYTAKTSEEIVNEQTYSFIDRGDRKVVMRPEMTPTVSRLVAARRQELAYPLRLFNIGNRFRYERPQKGRFREFWQLDADLFGVSGLEADLEIIQLVAAIMNEFGAQPNHYEIRVNSRMLLNKRIDEAGLVGDRNQVIRAIDKYEKITKIELIKQLAGKIADPVTFLAHLERDGTSYEIKELLKKAKELGIGNVKADETLARGFDYYTDFVFEVFDTNPENNRSMFGGGRYDGLVGEFSVEPIPTVGFAMGDATLQNFLKSNNLIPELKPATDLVVIGIDVASENLAEVASRLRAKNLNVAIDHTDRKIDKKIKAAEKLRVENVVFVGEEELSSHKFKLKDLKSGKEFNCSLEQVINLLKESSPKILT